jgi:nucleotide-binding universal stress UspA family protein
MYKKVVVPLDGSKLAETVLPHLEIFAKGCNIGDIMLVSVTEKLSGNIMVNDFFEQFVPEKPATVKSPQFTTFQPIVAATKAKLETQEMPVNAGKMYRSAAEYLLKIVQDLEEKGFDATGSVLIGHPAEEIVRFTESQHADLIIMASRGKSGLSRWEMGNIAEKVIRASKVPVLLVKPPAGFKETKRKRRGVAF